MQLDGQTVLCARVEACSCPAVELFEIYNTHEQVMPLTSYSTRFTFIKPEIELLNTTCCDRLWFNAAGLSAMKVASRFNGQNSTIVRLQQTGHDTMTPP